MFQRTNVEWQGLHNSHVLPKGPAEVEDSTNSFLETLSLSLESWTEP